MDSYSSDVDTKGAEPLEKKAESKEEWRAPRVRKLRVDRTLGPGDIHPTELSTYTGGS